MVVDVPIEALLALSFPRPGEGERLRALFLEEIATGRDSTGLAPRIEGGVERISFPTLMVAGKR